MNLKYILLFLPFILAFSSCDNANIGDVIQPEEDQMSVKCDTFHVKSENYFLSHRYSEASKVLLGRYDDPLYGKSKLDFITEFKYLKTALPKNVNTSELNIILYYKDFFGDSLSVQEASAYQIDQTLDFEHHYYSDENLSDYTDKSKFLGKRSFTPYDITVPDSVREEDDFCNTVKIKMPQSACDRLLTDETLIQSQDAFLDFLKGVYITNQYGDDAIVYIDSVDLRLDYTYTPDLAKPDSILSASRIYAANKEISEFIRVSDSDVPNIDSKPDSLLYLVSSPGLVTKLTFPFDKIYDSLVVDVDADTILLNINHASLIVEAASFDDYSGNIPYPEHIILIREADIDAFFRQSLYPAEGITTSIGTYNSAKGYYMFANSANFIQEVLAYKDSKPFDEVNDFVLLPISGYSGISGTSAVIRHQFKPRAIRLRSEHNAHSPMRLSITYSEL